MAERTREEEQADLRKTSRRLHDHEREARPGIEYVHAVRIVRSRDRDVEALADVAEAAGTAYVRALQGLAGALARRAAALEPPPGPHDDCLINCGLTACPCPPPREA